MCVVPRSVDMKVVRFFISIILKQRGATDGGEAGDIEEGIAGFVSPFGLVAAKNACQI